MSADETTERRRGLDRRRFFRDMLLTRVSGRVTPQWDATAGRFRLAEVAQDVEIVTEVLRHQPSPMS